jgi:hypothetical protein
MGELFDGACPAAPAALSKDSRRRVIFGNSGHFFGRNARHEEFAMAQPLTSPHDIPSARSGAVVVALAGGVIGAVVLLGTLALWARYGTAVFFDMIASGIAACL